MKRSKFSLTHYKLLSANMGSLIPLQWFEALPGDTIQQATSALIRCAPIVVPIMHPLHIRIHHWFVPNRIIWTNWENFITGGPSGTDATVHPYYAVTGNQVVSTLYDYLGLPTAGYSGTTYGVSALPFRAYSMIWNEFYRDQDLQTPLTVSLGDGQDSTTNMTLQQVCWEKDYLTTARPWESKGPAVTIPLAGAAPVAGIGFSGSPTLASAVAVRDSDGVASYPNAAEAFAAGVYVRATTSTPASTAPNVLADLAAAQNADINALRLAFAVQRYQEARARYGSRYVEYLRYLGVRSSDARLQRPEYLGGGRSTMQFSEVLQTAPTSAGTAGGAGGVGQFGGHGISAHRTNRYRRFFEEHGIVMTLMSIVPKSIYSQRVERQWLRGMGAAGPGATAGLSGTKEDYWQRELQHIGQQQINGLEVDASIGRATAFGFQDQYDEYRRKESAIAGNFRISGVLDMWNMAREFASAPSLNSTFVSCVPSNRGFANLSADQLYIMANHSIQARRLVAREGRSFAL